MKRVKWGLYGVVSAFVASLIGQAVSENPLRTSVLIVFATTVGVFLLMALTCALIAKFDTPLPDD